MRLSKASYYADLWLYPPVIIALLVTDFRSSNSHFFAHLAAPVSGILGWSFVEYVFHRFVLHSFPMIAKIHEMHHADPTAFVGTPTWLSLPAFGFGAFFPLLSVASLEISSGVMAGLLMGYVWYLIVHDAVHRWPSGHASVLYRAKLRHAAHHHGRQEGNFGVTTSFWDRVFGTQIVRASASNPFKRGARN